MIKKLVDVFKSFPTLVKETGVLIARNLILKNVRVVGSSQSHFDSTFLILTASASRFLLVQLFMVLK